MSKFKEFVLKDTVSLREILEAKGIVNAPKFNKDDSVKLNKDVKITDPEGNETTLEKGLQVKIIDITDEDGDQKIKVSVDGKTISVEAQDIIKI